VPAFFVGQHSRPAVAMDWGGVDNAGHGWTLTVLTLREVFGLYDTSAVGKLLSDLTNGTSKERVAKNHGGRRFLRMDDQV
jgi:hypothetical protein